MSQKRRTHHDEPFLLVRSLASTARCGHRIERHRHDWHQLIYASSGVLAVWTERSAWVVPSCWAVWVPAGIVHSISHATDSALSTLYLRPGIAAGLHDDCRVVGIGGLLRALILRTIDIGMLDERDTVEAALALLITDELMRSETPPLARRQPASAALRQAVSLMDMDDRGTARLAKDVGLSVRVLERRFKAETGLSPAHWRRRRAMLFAIERLAAGDPIKIVAAACGYAAPSAFVAAFRRHFGVTPARYVDLSRA